MPFWPTSSPLSPGAPGGAKGQEIPPALSRSAHRLLTAARSILHRFGPPDLFLPSWAATPKRAGGCPPGGAGCFPHASP